MENITENIKIILVKIAIELKRFGWKPNVSSNEIDLREGYIEMQNTDFWDGDEEDIVDIDHDLRFTLEENKQNNVFFLKYDNLIYLYVKEFGGSNRSNSGKLDLPITEEDAKDSQKMKEIANQLNEKISQKGYDEAYEFAKHVSWEREISS